MADQNNGYGAKNVKVVPVTTFLTQYTDGNGQEEVRMGFVIGDDIRFLEQKSLSRPAQSWLRDEIMSAINGDPEPEPLPAAPVAETSEVEAQV